MALRIEDYALISNSQSAALVGRDGSIDWLCLPNFDSSSCFSALLGTPDHGRWKIAPPDDRIGSFQVKRRYRKGTLVLETEFHGPDGSLARVVDAMIPGVRAPVLIRMVQGVRGVVPFRMELVLRFEYGSLVPWVRKMHNGHISGIVAIGGPDTIRVHARVPMRGEGYKTASRFEVREGQNIPFVLSWHPSHEEPYREAQALIDEPEGAIEIATQWWREWCSRSTYKGPWKEAVERSLLTLKALTHARTGGIVAAPTTSLPECIGGVRNWDYRYCWVRDATFSLFALSNSGYVDESRAWRDWLLRAVAGKPSDLQIMYGLAGERRLTEFSLPWLPGYEDSSPVRIGNLASNQLQLDVYGELLAAFYMSRSHQPRPPHSCAGTRVSSETDKHDWRVQAKFLEYLEKIWDQPDNGIWEVRGPRRHFTHSRVMAWVAFDRGIRAIEEFGLEGPLDRWKRLRQTIHDQVCHQGFNREKNAFTQYYGSHELDASLLLMPLVGFLPATDPRMVSTIEGIQRELYIDGFVYRYRTWDRKGPNVDGLPHSEGAFLPCSFWLADNLARIGRKKEARDLFERLLSIQNDLGLLPEEYDPKTRRFLGNFPQAFSHVSLVYTATHLADELEGLGRPETVDKKTSSTPAA